MWWWRQWRGAVSRREFLAAAGDGYRGGVGCNTGNEDGGSGRMLGCPPAGSETSMASKAGLGVF